MTTTTKTTADVLADMFTENTGRHMLDSGSAYGRNWERNANMTTRDFLAAPRVTVSDDYATQDAFLWLLDRVSYDHELDAEFQKYYDASDNYALEDMETWPEDIGGKLLGTVNTYNYDDTLSQTLQFTVFEYGATDYVLLQVHGGCDIRGGYTRPRLFACANGYESLYDFTNVWLFCDACGFRVEYCNGREDYAEHGGTCGPSCGATDNAIPTQDGPTYSRPWRLADGCPCCGGELS